MQGMPPISTNNPYWQPSVTASNSKSEEIIQKIIHLEKEINESELQDISPIFHWSIDWKKQEETYRKFEDRIQGGQKQPTWEVGGPLNYSMSTEEMKNVIIQKFRQMSDAGKLLTKKSFKERFSDNEMTKSGWTGTGCKLTRIWGEEFLRENLKNHKELNVIEHFLVIDDSATDLEVNVEYSHTPVTEILKNACIFSKIVYGESTNLNGKLQAKNDLFKLGFHDFNGIGNIKCDINNINWVIDTEINSFNPPKIQRQFADYLKKRLNIISNQDIGTKSVAFKISTSELVCRHSSLN